MILLVALSLLPPPTFQEECQLVRVPTCRSMGYNLTHLPNMAGHTTQEEVMDAIASLSQFLNSNCSPFAPQFVCTSLAPVCTRQRGILYVLTPCRSLCERVRSDCLPALQLLGIGWPQHFACTNYKRRNESLCIFNEYLSPSSPTTPSTLPCPPNTVRVKTADGHECFPSCRAPDSDEPLEYARKCLIVLSICCCAFSCFSLAGLLVERVKLDYPEKPMLFVVSSFLLYSLLNFSLSMMINNSIFCRETEEGDLYEVTNGIHCVVIYALQEFFVYSARMWIFVMAISWFLASSQKWGQESINKSTGMFHMSAWFVPVLLAMVGVFTKVISPSEISGICQVDLSSSAGFSLSLIPHSVLSLLTTLFLSLGIRDLVKTKRQLILNGFNTTNLSTLLHKFVLFAVFYSSLAFFSILLKFFYFFPIPANPFFYDIIPAVETSLNFVVGIFCSFWLCGPACLATLYYRARVHFSRNNYLQPAHFGGDANKYGDVF